MKTRKRGTKKNKRTRKKRGSGEEPINQERFELIKMQAEKVLDYEGFLEKLKEFLKELKARTNIKIKKNINEIKKKLKKTTLEEVLQFNKKIYKNQKGGNGGDDDTCGLCLEDINEDNNHIPSALWPFGPYTDSQGVVHPKCSHNSSFCLNCLIKFSSFNSENQYIHVCPICRAPRIRTHIERGMTLYDNLRNSITLLDVGFLLTFVISSFMNLSDNDFTIGAIVLQGTIGLILWVIRDFNRDDRRQAQLRLNARRRRFLFDNDEIYFGGGGRRKKKTRKMRGGWNGEDCPICVEKMLDESKVINVHVGSTLLVPPGPHYFHKECIHSWKKYDRQAECPSCRQIMEYRLNDNLWPMGAAYTQATTGEFMKCAECKNVLTEEEEVRVISGEAPPICPECLQQQQTGGKRRKKTRKYKGNKYPYKNITKKEAIADFIKLKTTTNPRSLNGLEIVNYGTEKLRVRTKYRGKSLIERWKDKKARKTLKKFANRLYKGSYTDSLLHAYRSAIALSWGTLSSMRTSAALQMYRKYNAKKVLDFTAGWGSRMTAALAADIDYIGIDTNKSLKKGYNKILKATKKHTKSKVKLFFQPAETVDYSKLDYDFVFTSPPYEYLELYEHMKNYEGTRKIKQAYSANDTKRKNDGFYDTFLIPTIKEIYKHLPKGKWICLNVPDLMYDKIKKKWKACDKKEDYMISKRVGSVMKAADRRGQEFVYCWKKK